MKYKILTTTLMICAALSSAWAVVGLPIPSQKGCETKSGAKLNTTKHSYKYEIPLNYIHRFGFVQYKGFNYIPTKESQKIINAWIVHDKTKDYIATSHVYIPLVTLYIKDKNGDMASISFNDYKIFQSRYSRDTTKEDKALIKILKQFANENGIPKLP